MLKWYDYGLLYTLFYIPYLIWGERYFLWLHWSTPRDIKISLIKLAFTSLIWHLFLAPRLGFEYTLPQAKQVLIVAVLFGTFFAVKNTFFSKGSSE